MVSLRCNNDNTKLFLMASRTRNHLQLQKLDKLSHWLLTVTTCNIYSSICGNQKRKKQMITVKKKCYQDPKITNLLVFKKNPKVKARVSI